ncbi:MAG: hypothetical protein ACTSP4_11700 [Candidatus Hodarchaeales archaeon]
MNTGNSSPKLPSYNGPVNTALFLTDERDSLQFGSGTEFPRNKESLLSMISPLLARSLEGKEQLYAHSLARELTDLYFHQKRVEANRSYLKELLIESDQVNITIFKTGMRGSEVVFTDDLSFIDHSDPLAQETLLGKLGTYYIFGLGQGNTPSFGLYELPVAEYSEMSALVYSFKASDPSNPDERMNGQEYCVMAIFYPKRYSKAFSDRYAIKRYLDSKIKQLKTLEGLDRGFSARLKKELLS